MQMSVLTNFYLKAKTTATISLMALAFVTAPCAFAEGLGFDKTRLVISEGQTGGSVVLDNRTNKGYIVRAHLEDSEHVKTDSGVVRPPLFQVKPQQAGRIRVVVDPKKVATDRETMFWLYTKSYPAKSPEEVKQQLNFNFVIQMKVFYRPNGLKGTLLNAAEKLQWRYDKGQLFVKNDSPFNISLAGFLIDDKPIDTNIVIKPYSEINSGVILKAKLNKLTWFIIDDLGEVKQFSSTM